MAVELRELTKPILDGHMQSRSTKEGVSQASTNGLASVLSAASKAADLYPHDIEGLLQILHFRNQIAKSASRRNAWFIGRLYNKFSGEHPDYIPISGTHLRQTFSILNIDVPDSVVASGQYRISLGRSERAVKVLSEMRDLEQGLASIETKR